MTLMSAKTHTALQSKTIFLSIALCILSLAGVFLSSVAFANSCSRSDIDYYLQRGFSNEQVVQLCAGPTTAQNTSQQTYQAPSQAPNALREDESYLSAAIDADDVKMTPQTLTLYPRECIKYGPPNNTDLIEDICVNTKLTISFSGLKVGKSKKGIFLVRDATVDLSGNIKRELVGLNELRRQDREAIIETLSLTPRNLKMKIRSGINPGSVGQRLKKYAK